jgi:hypothetical protein
VVDASTITRRCEFVNQSRGSKGQSPYHPESKEGTVPVANSFTSSVSPQL